MVSIIFRACLGKHLLQLAGLLSLLSVLLLQFSTVSFQILLLLEHFQILAFGLRLKQISGQLQLPKTMAVRFHKEHVMACALQKYTEERMPQESWWCEFICSMSNRRWEASGGLDIYILHTCV